MPPTNGSDVPQSILVVRLSALGDVLFALPAVEALRRRHPSWQFDWLVEDRAATLLDLYPALRRRIVYPRRAISEARGVTKARLVRRHLSALRESFYDVVLDVQGNLKSGVQTRLARATRRIGFAHGANKERNHWWTSEAVQPPAGAVHRVQKGLSLARHLEPSLAAHPPRPPLVVPDAATTAAEALIAQCGLAGTPFGVLHPGTSAFGAFKRWDPERFGALGTRLHRDTGLPWIVTWGPGEEELARAAADAGDSSVQCAPPTRSLAELAALLERASLFVGCDSAPLHLADQLGTPTVALFGPKDPALYRPWFSPHRVVHTWLPCSPCPRRRCPDALCMKEIRVEQVEAAAHAVLRDQATEPSS